MSNNNYQINKEDVVVYKGDAEKYDCAEKGYLIVNQSILVFVFLHSCDNLHDKGKLEKKMSILSHSLQCWEAQQQE